LPSFFSPGKKAERDEEDGGAAANQHEPFGEDGFSEPGDPLTDKDTAKRDEPSYDAHGKTGKKIRFSAESDTGTDHKGINAGGDGGKK
jgi:hypothetical protein